MKTLIAIILCALTITVAGLFGQTAHAIFDPFAPACLNSQGQGTVCEDAKKNQDLNGGNSLLGPGGLITKIVTILNIVIGIVSVIMVIIGGLKLVLSNGDSNNVNSARNTIIYALVGIVIAVSGQLIVNFVLSKL